MVIAFPAVQRALAALALAAVALTGPTAQAGTIRGGVPFGMRIGDEVTIAETGVIVRFNEVTEDSRCPIDAICVWAGVLRISLTVSAGVRDTHDIEIDTMGATAEVGGYVFTLVVAKPSRRADVPIEPGDYGVVVRADPVNR